MRLSDPPKVTDILSIILRKGGRRGEKGGKGGERKGGEWREKQRQFASRETEKVT